jgi:hypothetical protein
VSKYEELIGRALSEEDRAFLASHSEPGYLAQAFGLLRGPMAGVLWLVHLANVLAFVAGAYAFWQAMVTTEAVLAVKWGVGALALFQVTILCKTFLGNRMETNRLLREIKRVELQVAMLRSDPSAHR